MIIEFSQPRIRLDVCNNLAEVAQIAQRLRNDHPDRIGLSIVCEVSLLHRGILPGDLAWRTRWLAVVSALAPPFIGWRLNKVLNEMLEIVRRYFDVHWHMLPGPGKQWTGRNLMLSG